MTTSFSDLLTALRGLVAYARHERNCEKLGPVWGYPRYPHDDLSCTCGLDALLAHIEGPRVEPPCVQCGTTEARDGDWYRLCGECRWKGAQIEGPGETEKDYRYWLRQCYVLARREAAKEQKADDTRSSRWNHVIRFCKEADTDGTITASSVLREATGETKEPQA